MEVLLTESASVRRRAVRTVEASEAEAETEIAVSPHRRQAYCVKMHAAKADVPAHEHVGRRTSVTSALRIAEGARLHLG